MIPESGGSTVGAILPLLFSFNYNMAMLLLGGYFPHLLYSNVHLNGWFRYEIECVAAIEWLR